MQLEHEELQSSTAMFDNGSQEIGNKIFSECDIELNFIHYKMKIWSIFK